MATGKSRAGSCRVRKLRNVLQSDKRRRCRLPLSCPRRQGLANGFPRGSPGKGPPGWRGCRDRRGDGRPDREAWAGAMARGTVEGNPEETHVPGPVRRRMIPSRQPGQFRPSGIPCIRDRVARISAMLVLEPIFEADLQPEQHAWRPGRSARDAACRVHKLLNTGHGEVVGSPVQRLRRDTARRTDEEHRPSCERWPHARTHQGVAGNAGRRGGRQGRQVPHQPCSQAAERNTARCLRWPRISACAASPGRKVRGLARRFHSEIVDHADDSCVIGRAPAAEMLPGPERITDSLKLPAGEHETRCLRCPEEPLKFPGYRIGRNWRARGKGSYVGTRPSRASVQGIRRKVGWMTTGRNALTCPGTWWNALTGCCPDGRRTAILARPVRPVGRPANTRAGRCRQRLCHKHEVGTGKHVRPPDQKLWRACGLTRLVPKTGSLPWAKT